MPTTFNINSNITGARDFGLPFCTAVYTARLAATTDTSLTVPSKVPAGLPGFKGRFVAVFSYSKLTTKDVWVAIDATAAVPAGAGFAASTSELNPSAKYVKAGQVIHMLAVTADTDVSVAFYAIQE